MYHLHQISQKIDTIYVQKGDEQKLPKNNIK